MPSLSEARSSTPIPPAQQADIYRLEVSGKLDKKKRGALGQYLTPLAVSTFMASLFDAVEDDVVLLDPGAGTGSLTAAFVEEIVGRKQRPASITVEGHEIESLMTTYLDSTLESCAAIGRVAQVHVAGSISQEDFVEWGARNIQDSESLWGAEASGFTHCIANPPYKKIRSDSRHRALLRSVGIETGNLYSAFLALTIKLLAPGGELVVIVPRSFCNGPYFKPFRELLLSEMAIRQLHVFESRKQAFKDDDVLQENIIIHAVKGALQGQVVLTASSGSDFDDMSRRTVDFDKVVNPGDPDQFIHIAASELEQMIVDRMGVFTSSLEGLGISVCTGPVVDFRLRSDIRQQAEDGACPLIYPGHFSENFIEWPKPDGKKPNAILESESSSRWLMPNGCYVVTKRFSSKEEKRRIVAALHLPEAVPGAKIGFENHLNVFHIGKSGLDPRLAKGLAVFLNSSLLDLYFRQFSGHTQVNATDLKSLHYPSHESLLELGERVGSTFPGQDEVDGILDAHIRKLSGHEDGDPLVIIKRTAEALEILKALGLPKKQHNDRSALTLLALIDLKPKSGWERAGDHLIGITPIMDFIRDHYRKEYAPNTRETIRRQTMHQFVDAGIALRNPDEPDRAVNSAKTCYQISPHTLELLRAFGTKPWDSLLRSYLKEQSTLAEQYAKRRDMELIPVEINGGKKLALTPGKHSQLIKDIIKEFGPRYAPGSEVLYVGDTGTKLGHYDKKTFKKLGLTFDSHGKFPDVVLYFRKKNWLLLIESVTSHGPVDGKRHSELSKLFAKSKAGLVYVTAFPDRQTMGKYLGDISWETEVWVADAPTHLIHFNGVRFLGPYGDE